MQWSHWCRVGRSGVHGRGVFARRVIPAGTRVVQYLGEKITKAEAVRREEQRLQRLAKGGDGSVFIFELNRTHDLDGRIRANPARWINHSCAPNCESQQIRGRIWIVALRDIAAGEELNFDYGYSYAEWQHHPCRCGAARCVGYIVRRDQRWRVRRLLKTRNAATKPAAAGNG